MPRVVVRLRPLLGSLVLASACGPFVILDDSGSDDESSETDEVSEETTTPPTTTSTTSSTTSATTSTTTATTATTTTTGDPTGDVPGFCAQACAIVEDCLYEGANPSDFACVDGFCEYVGEIPPCDPASCDDIMIGSCTEIDGVSVCATPCADDSACLPGFTECTGHDDAGNSICEAIPCFGTLEGEPCEIQGFGQIGVCTNGQCSCTDDSECTAEGFGCNG
jgi:hypothetical protein